MGSESGATHDAPSSAEKAKQACIYCRRRKIGCDRRLPSCTSCQQRNKVCEYTLTAAKQRKLWHSTQPTHRRPVPIAIRPNAAASSSTSGPDTPSPLMDLAAVPIASDTSRTPETVPLLASSDTLLATPDSVLTSPAMDDWTVASLASSSRGLTPPTDGLAQLSLEDRITAARLQPLTDQYRYLQSMVDELEINPETAFRLMQKLFSSFTLTSQLHARLATPFPNISGHKPGNPYAPFNAPNPTNLTDDTTLPDAPWSAHVMEQFGVQPFANDSDPITYLLRRLSQTLLSDHWRLSYDNAFIGCRPFLDTNADALYAPDLLFHSHVIQSLLYLFCRVAYAGMEDLHYNRILMRLKLGLIKEGILLALLATVAPLSEHPVFQHIPPYLAGTFYYQRLTALIPEIVETTTFDDTMALMVLSEYEMGRGDIEASFNFSAMCLRRLQQFGVDLMDHPARASGQKILAPGRWTAQPSWVTTCDRLLRENTRALWWKLCSNDAITSLVFGRPPLTDMDMALVLCPGFDDGLSRDIVEQLADPQSPLYISPDYPTLLLRHSFTDSGRQPFLDLRRVAHRVATIRANQADDPGLWLRELAPLNQELGKWVALYPLVFSPMQNVYQFSDLSHLERHRLRHRLLAQITFHTVRIYLNHISPIDPWPFAAAADNIRAMGDTREAIQAHCQKLCWESTQALRNVVLQFVMLPSLLENTLLAGALHASAVICIEVCQQEHSPVDARLGASPDPSAVAWAQSFLDEIEAFLAQFGQLWLTNLKVVQTIGEMRTSRRRKLSVTISRWLNLGDG
ncbi:hypothetical protein H4R34_003994 [Dimargaris verticillata]|uniref:Zn(2)-C6 fungal-type domain-containing protein n=1 Tax=Dimargaris verticillata TaxID=2761393 RepID=A0A9W8EBJ0_9FUNG|nr:hypothetical protein H4R34_003994 [Dimargaris verticillata]